MFALTRLGLTVATVSLSLVATSAPAVALPDWRTSQAAQRSSSLVRVLDLRHAQHPRFDRVVIDLRGMRPGYTISYTRRLFREGSARPVRLAGRQKMFLSLAPAYAHDNAGHFLYDGPRKVRTGYPTLKGIAFTGDFEGRVTFGFGTDRRAPYRIFTLDSPRRLVVDWKH
jgi:hypothetical protein